MRCGFLEAEAIVLSEGHFPSKMYFNHHEAILLQKPALCRSQPTPSVFTLPALPLPIACFLTEGLESCSDYIEGLSGISVYF